MPGIQVPSVNAKFYILHFNPTYAKSKLKIQFINTLIQAATSTQGGDPPIVYALFN